MCCSINRKTLPRVSTVGAITTGGGPIAAAKPVTASRETVKSSLASQRNVKQSSGMSSRRQPVKSTSNRQDTVSSRLSVITAKTLSQDLPAPTNKSSSVSRDKMLNQRRSVTSQFLRSSADQHRTMQLPAATDRPQTAYDRRKSYQVPLIANQKTAHQISNSQNFRDQRKSSQTKLSSRTKAAGEMTQFQSCHDRRKSYQAELLVRQKAVLAASKKAIPRHSTVAVAKNDKSVEASSLKLSDNPRMSTPSTCRRTAATMTPSLSCIPRRKTVSFVTPASHNKTTPQLHRNQPVRKEMSMR